MSPPAPPHHSPRSRPARSALRGSVAWQWTWRDALRNPLSLPVVLACVFILSGMWWNTLQRITTEHDQALQASQQSMKHLAMAYEQHVFRTLRTAEQIAALVREQYLSQPLGTSLSHWAEQGIIRESMFRILSVVDAQGRIVASSAPAATATQNVNYADRAFFRFHSDHPQASDRLYISDPVLGRVSGRWQIPMSLRISHPNAAFAGVVVLSVDTQHFTDFYEHTPLHAAGLMELIGTDGVVRSRNLGGQHTFGHNVPTLQWFAHYAQSRASKQAIDRDELVLDDGADLDGQTRLISYRDVQGYPLVVAVGMPISAALHDVQLRRVNYLRNAVIATAVLVVFTLALLIALARQQAITQALHKLQERLSHSALHDALTDLPNRTLFQDRLEQALESARRNQELLAVLYVDLDGFKTVNDQWGHHVGDVLLQQVAQRLQACLRAQDTVARFGGDEFGLVLPALTQVQDCDTVAHKVLATLASPFDLGAVRVQISASIGAALFPAQGSDASALLLHADHAMYHAKHQGKNGLSYDAPTLGTNKV